MKKIYITALLFIAALSVSNATMAQTTLIAPPDGIISVVKAGKGAENYAITNPASSGDIAITKKGSVLMLGGTTLTEAAFSSSDGSVSLELKKPIWADFDIAQSNEITPQTIKTESENKYSAATADKNIKIDMSDYSDVSGEITLEFDMLLDKAYKTNLFTVYDENAKKTFEVQLRFRNDENVYIAYQRDKYNYTALRTKLLPINERVHIEAVIDTDNYKVSLYCNSEEIFKEKPMLYEATPTSFAIGTGTDNIAVYSGRKLTSAALRIDTSALSLTSEHAFVSKTLSASVKLFDEYEEIDAKYLYWSAPDNAFCTVSSDGVLTADTAALTEQKTLNVSAVLSCSKEDVSTQSEITVSAAGADGQAASGEKGNVIAYLSKSENITAGDTISVTAVAYNSTAAAQTYYVVVPLTGADGKNVQNHVFKMECSELSGRVSRSFDITVNSGASLAAQVFVFDKDFRVNVLR